jgi:hypothetical protein
MTNCEKYDIHSDLIQKMMSRPISTQCTGIPMISKQPFILNTKDYHDIRKNLNSEKQSITK